MPLKSYGVLKARLKARRASTEKHMHYHLWVEANGLDYRASVSVRSVLHPSEMEYLIDFQFRHPITRELASLSPGFHALEPCPGTLALDYIRCNLVERNRFLTLPCTGPGCGADLNEVLDNVICAAIADPECWIYIYGEPWEAQATDRIFRFFPSLGIHDVHMNQGNAPGHWEQDGSWQDGAILIERPRQRRWVGVFLKFQSQSWHTDDVTGHALTASFFHEGDGVPLDRHGVPRPDGMVRIIAAMVHSPDGAKQRPESVTLFNVCPIFVDLTGWMLVNREKRRWRLRGGLAPGEAREIPLGASMPLGNRGGVITLLNRQGLKVHGVSYTAEQASEEGWSITF